MVTKNASIPGARVTTELISQTSYTIVNLEEFTNYSIEVTAVTVGEGPYSTPIIVITDQDCKMQIIDCLCMLALLNEVIFPPSAGSTLQTSTSEQEGAHCLLSCGPVESST